MALEAQVRDLDRVLMNLGEGVVAIDHAGIVVHANPAAVALLGIEADRVRGQHAYVAIAVPEIRDALAHVMSGSLDDTEAYTVEVEVPERARTLRVRVTPLRDDGSEGSAAGAIAVISDVTDIRRVEQMRADFFTNVSHELKTPMAAIRGIVETMIDDPAMPEADRSMFLAKAVRQTDRLDTLLADLIAISRLESDVASVRSDAVDLGAIMREVLATVAHRAQRSGIDVHAHIDDQLVVRGDEEAIRQAITNLVVNALTYTDSGGSVTVEVARCNDRASVSVSDTGIGIPLADQARIFERFYRVDPARSRARGGSGLGLSIVKHVARVHGGDITLTSSEGAGSAFTLTLPVHA